MKNDELKAGLQEEEFIPVERCRMSEEEFEMGDEEPCLASAD